MTYFCKQSEICNVFTLYLSSGRYKYSKLLSHFSKLTQVSVVGMGLLLYFRYKVRDLEDGNLLEISLRAEACFNDGGMCAVNISILEGDLIPKWNKKWTSPYTVKGKCRVLVVNKLSLLNAVGWLVPCNVLSCSALFLVWWTNIIRWNTWWLCTRFF